jgi:GTPase-associated system-like protein
MLAKRWAAVEALAKSKARTALLSLVRVAKGTIDTTVVVEAARAADGAFQTHDCGPELRVLAGAAIGEILKQATNEADAIALATVSASFAGKQGDALFRRVNESAKEYLATEATRVRAADHASVGTKATDYDAAVAGFTKGTQGQQPQIVADQTGALVKNVTKIQAEAIAEMRKAIDALREESNMFWWAFAVYSRDLDRPLRQLGLAPSCVVAAKELADLTMLLPGPRSAAALLDRVLAEVDGTAATVALADAVNGTDRAWRSRWIKAYDATGLGELAPVLLATAESLRTESPSDWISAFAKSTGISNASLSPPALALQAYSESLLMRAVAQLS